MMMCRITIIIRVTMLSNPDDVQGHLMVATMKQ